MRPALGEAGRREPGLGTGRGGNEVSSAIIGCHLKSSEESKTNHDRSLYTSAVVGGSIRRLCAKSSNRYGRRDPKRLHVFAAGSSGYWIGPKCVVIAMARIPPLARPSQSFAAGALQTARSRSPCGAALR
jgi:hypothetical protein